MIIYFLIVSVISTAVAILMSNIATELKMAGIGIIFAIIGYFVDGPQNTDSYLLILGVTTILVSIARYFFPLPKTK